MKGFEELLRNVAVILVLLVLALFIVTLLGGCTTVKTVEVEKVRTDTLWQNHTLRDSIYIAQHDSIVTYRDGDTVTVEKWHWRDRWRDRVKTDTIYKSKTDTVTKTITKTKTDSVLTWWQKVRMWIGTAALVLLVLLVVVKGTILLGPRR
jgi:ABC-type phosphate transport system permease subunit